MNVNIGSNAVRPAVFIKKTYFGEWKTEKGLDNSFLDSPIELAEEENVEEITDDCELNEKCDVEISFEDEEDEKLKDSFDDDISVASEEIENELDVIGDADSVDEDNSDMGDISDNQNNSDSDNSSSEEEIKDRSAIENGLKEDEFKIEEKLKEIIAEDPKDEEYLPTEELVEKIAAE